ncbi:MAG TPA: aminoglycoside phosphotransferase family protein [Solirubrobacteraceae bacterium]|nr:aminoglycoside phosphotransferase family protein [Solirubrobacteraceae bacterium]
MTAAPAAALARAIAAEWGLTLGDRLEPGVASEWIGRARTSDGAEVVLKLSRRHWEGDHEADGLLAWDGGGAIRCLRSAQREDTCILLLESCRPGTALGAVVSEVEQDVIVAGLLGRLWQAPIATDAPFRPLQFMCDRWASSFERRMRVDGCGLDPGLARAGHAALRELPATATRTVLLCTDLHAGNVLAARREPWLVIDPKPFVGDPAYDVVQHMLNCDERLTTDPVALAGRMAALVDLDPERVSRWLFARCAQEAIDDLRLRTVAQRLASAVL